VRASPGRVGPEEPDRRDEAGRHYEGDAGRFHECLGGFVISHSWSLPGGVPVGYPGRRHRIAEAASMSMTLDRSWAVIAAIAVAACLAIYWQAAAIESARLPEDLGLQLEDVGVGIGDERDLAGAQVHLVAVPVM
jgi:hypothetical protein